MSTREEVYQAIDGERAYQAERWNASTTDSKGIHNNTEFLVYIKDYVEEALHHISRNSEPGSTVFSQNSLRKIAALAVAALEQNGVTQR